MRKDILEHVLQSTNTFSANPLAQYCLPDDEEGKIVLPIFENFKELPEETGPIFSTKGTDWEKALVKPLELHERYARSKIRRVFLEGKKQGIYYRMKDNCDKFNAMLNSQEYEFTSYSERQKLWEDHKLYCASMKGRMRKAKPFISEAWNEEKKAYKRFSDYMSESKLWWLWNRFLNEEASDTRYWTTCGSTWQEEEEPMSSAEQLQKALDLEFKDIQKEKALLERISVPDKEIKSSIAAKGLQSKFKINYSM